MFQFAHDFLYDTNTFVGTMLMFLPAGSALTGMALLIFSGNRK